MSIRTVFLAVLFALLPLSALAARKSDYEIVASPPGLARGDSDAALSALAGVIERNPESPLVLSALSRMNDLEQYAVDDSAVTDRLAAVVKKGIANGENDEAVRRYLRERLRERGDIKAARDLSVNRGYLRHWAVVGPFGFSASSLLYHRFGPEESLDLKKRYRDLEKVRRFIELPVGDGRAVEPFAVLEGNGGVTYSVDQFVSKKQQGAILKVPSSGAIRVWLNGEEVLSIDRLRKNTPWMRYASVVLRRGGNRILVKGAGDGTQFSVKLCDPQTMQPLSGIREVSGLENLSLGAPARNRPAVKPFTRPEDRLKSVGSAYAQAARAILLEGQGMPLEALVAMKKAAKALPDDPGVHYLLGRQYENASGLPSVWRKNQAKLQYAKALAKDKEYSPAIVRLAALKHASDRSEEAAGQLRALLAKLPHDLSAEWLLCRIASDRKWEKEAVGAARACIGIAPRFGPALTFLANHANRYNDRAEARKWLEQELKSSNDDYGALSSLARFDAAAGDLASAIERLRRISEFWPHYTGSRAQVAAYLADEGHFDGALTILKKIAATYPTAAGWPRRIGDLLRRKGDVPGAIAAYEKSLAIDRGQPDLRRYVEELQKKKTDFSLPYDEDATSLLHGAPGATQYPRCPAVCLLDQTVLRVWPDGSTTAIVHMVQKILNEKGVDAFGRVDTGGDTLEVRTIDKNGKVWEPIGVDGSSYNMPALAPGSVVDYRYRVDQSADSRSFDTGRFYFADVNYSDAEVVSRWIVILPKGFDADLLLRNFHGKHEVKVEGDTVVHVFEVRKAPRTEVEPMMPKRAKLLPWARFLRNRPFEDVPFVLSDRVWQSVDTPPLVRETAAKVAGGEKSALAKAKSLYAYVNRLVTGDSSDGGPSGTILEKSGDRFSLLASLLLAAHVPFQFAMACPDRGRYVDPDVVDPDVFDERCMKLSVGGGAAVWIFDAARFAPFGRIPKSYRDSPVMLLDRSGGKLETLPAEPDRLYDNQTTVHVVLGAKPADTTAVVRLDYRADGGYAYKQRIRRTDADGRRQAIEGWLGRMFTGPRISKFAFPDLDAFGKHAVLVAQVGLPNFVQANGADLECGLGFRPLNLASTYVGKPKRVHPMVIDTDYGMTDRVVIDLSGYRVVSLPPDHVTLGPLGAYSLTFRRIGDRVVVERHVRFRPTRLTKGEYPAMVRWVKEIDQAESRHIHLAPQKGK